MLRNVKALRGYAIRATDGVVGKVDDFYFDDEDWAIRYLVVDTGSWLSGAKVLIPPIFLGHADSAAKTLPVCLTMKQVESSPGIDTQKLVSRQHEAEYFGYFWGGAGLWGMGAYPGSLTAQASIEQDLKDHGTRETRTLENYHLRSSTAVIGHHVGATDGDIGHLEDLLVDDHTWAIRYLIVNTSNWWGGHHVLIEPQWVEDVSWPNAKVSIDLTRRAIKDAPRYDPAAQLDRQQEQELLRALRSSRGAGRPTLSTRPHDHARRPINHTVPD